jgi:hypothetical protein
MSANRLGLRNPEEVYLGRMLLRSADALAASDPELWRGLRERIIAPPEGAGERLAELLPCALAALGQALPAGLSSHM